MIGNIFDQLIDDVTINKDFDKEIVKYSKIGFKDFFRTKDLKLNDFYKAKCGAWNFNLENEEDLIKMTKKD